MEMKESQTHTWTLTLHQHAKKVFPVFLDCLCSPPAMGILGINVSNAVALRHLRNYFGVD